MPKRWERELQRLVDVQAPLEDIRSRSTHPSTGPAPTNGLPPMRQRVVAGIVAFGVFIAAGTFLIRAIDPSDPRRPVGPAGDLPTLQVRFQSDGTIDDGSQEPPRRVVTVVDYGDLHDESFTSTMAAGITYVDYISVDQMTPLFPAPTAGSAVSMEADGDDPRVLIGAPEDWPAFDRFEPIDRLPAEPGEYVLILEADYPEGIASTARLVDIVAQGTVQLAPVEGKALDAATATLVIDGRSNDGFMSSSSIASGDARGLSPSREPSFSPSDYIAVSKGAPFEIDDEPDSVRVLMVPISPRGPRASIDPSTDPSVVFDADPGRFLLSVEAVWKEGKLGFGNDGTREEALFYFPIKVVSGSPPEVASPPAAESGVTVALVDDSSIVLTVGGREFEPLVTDVIDYRVTVDIPAGLEVRVEASDGTEWAADLMRTGRKQLGSGVPRLPAFRGTALWFWKFELPDGKVVAGHFAIELAPTEGAPSDVLRIRCDRQGVTTVLTPFVAAQADGVRVVVLPFGTPQTVEFRESGSDTSFGGKIAADGEPHTWPIAPGAAEVSCGNGELALARAQPFEVVDPAGNWAEPELSCADTARAEVVGYDGGAVLWVSEEGAIRGILAGILPDDRVMQPLFGQDRLLRWVIVRHGAVVAVVGYTPVTDVSDPRGGGLGRVTGEVCASSGISGTVPPRDPDQDGVDLDCMAESQVAFGRPKGMVRLPEGESFITANVSGIRSTDRLVSPEGIDGSDGWDGVWTIERESKTVASINYPALDGITCRFNAIGTADSN